MATKHEALLKVEDNAAAKGIKAGETVTLIGSMGRADGKVVLNEVVSDKMKRTILAFSLIAGQIVFMPLAFAFPPSGSYQSSCGNIHRDGRDLLATCKDTNGSWVNTRLSDYVGCKPGTIDNVDGQLECDRQ